MAVSMPKEHIPTTPNTVPLPIEDEEYIADRVEKDAPADGEDEEEIEEGGLGPRG